jgi:hypothetical protein
MSSSSVEEVAAELHMAAFTPPSTSSAPHMGAGLHARQPPAPTLPLSVEDVAAGLHVAAFTPPSPTLPSSVVEVSAELHVAAFMPPLPTLPSSVVEVSAELHVAAFTPPSTSSEPSMGAGLHAGSLLHRRRRWLRQVSWK